MPGKLIHATPLEHFCAFPGSTLPDAPSSDIGGPGSIWECDCGKRWINRGRDYGWWPEHMLTREEPRQRRRIPWRTPVGRGQQQVGHDPLPVVDRNIPEPPLTNVEADCDPRLFSFDHRDAKGRP